ncbi:hypothetical protein REPUB_Repub19eG0117100 [Reevesia pubescens]
MVTALFLAISYPTLAMFINVYKNVLDGAVATEYSFPQADKVKEFLADPSKFAIVAAPITAAVAGAAPAATAAEEEKKLEPEEKSDDDMGFSLKHQNLLTLLYFLQAKFSFPFSNSKSCSYSWEKD